MNPSSMTRIHRFFLHAVQCRLRPIGAIERVQEQPGRGRVLHPALPLSRLQHRILDPLPHRYHTREAQHRKLNCTTVVS